MAPEAFPQTTTPDEVRIYGDAIEYGYTAADELLSRMLRLLDGSTTLVVASSMGQKPYISALRNGKPISQLRSLDRLMEIVGLNGRVRALSTMSDQFNLYPDTAATSAEATKILEAAYVDEPGRAMFDVHRLEDCLTVNLKFYEETSEDIALRLSASRNRQHFPLFGSRLRDRPGQIGMPRSERNDDSLRPRRPRGRSRRRGQ